MKKVFLLTLLIVLKLSIFAQPKLFTLEIEIIGIRSNNGSILLQLFNEDGEVLKGLAAKISNNKSLITIKGLKAGKYAIRYFHDENDNDKMDTNWLGYPTEGWGFSNNVKSSIFGVPPLSERLFELNGNKKINLEISY
jgi:uncharacterized protein (DUF2141 family)